MLPKSFTLSAGKVAGINGVHTGPGATQLARMRFGISDWAREKVNATIAPFVVE
jgi:hypothetical protein